MEPCFSLSTFVARARSRTLTRGVARPRTSRFRTGASGGGSLAALLLEERHQRPASPDDVIAEQPRRLGRISLASRGRDPAVLVARASFAVRQRQLHPQIAVAVLVQLAHDAHRERAVGRRVEDNLDGTFTQLDDDYYVPATGWSYLDLYLMGLISPREVPDFFILRNLVPQGRDANGRPIFKADRTKVTIQDVIAVEGPRLPDVDHSQKEFNTGMVVVVEHGRTPSKELLERTEGIRLRWMDYWTTTTGHRSTMTTNPR